MQENNNKEKLMKLCEQAANEQDSEKLMVLIVEINVLLEAKELRLKGKAPAFDLPPKTD